MCVYPLWMNGTACSVDAGSTVHACLVDMAKAFDRVNHALLIHSLSTLGVSKKELSWFQSYLKNRSVCTTVHWCKSSFQNISSGVPQGSVVGPLLFIIFYQNVPGIVSSSCPMFADVTLLFGRCSGTSDPEHCCRLQEDIPLQENLPRLDAWAGDWCTTFNPSTSAHMLLNSDNRQKSSHPHPTLSHSGGTIPLVPSTTHLGVRLSCSLLWSEHVSRAIQRVHFKVFTLKRLAHRPGSGNLVKHLYLSLVRPALEYAAPVWD